MKKYYLLHFLRFHQPLRLTLKVVMAVVMVAVVMVVAGGEAVAGVGEVDGLVQL